MTQCKYDNMVINLLHNFIELDFDQQDIFLLRVWHILSYTQKCAIAQVYQVPDPPDPYKNMSNIRKALKR